MKHELKALEWLKEVPAAYELFDRFATEMAESGEIFGSKLIFERMRYECRLRKLGEYKVNNNYASFVGRLWAERNPRHAHLLKFRKVKED